MEFPRKRFIELVKNYVHYRRMKEIQDNVQRMKLESNVDERVLQAMKDAEERVIRVGHQNCFLHSCVFIQLLQF